jgi:hypothetical protein
MARAALAAVALAAVFADAGEAASGDPELALVGTFSSPTYLTSPPGVRRRPRLPHPGSRSNARAAVRAGAWPAGAFSGSPAASGLTAAGRPGSDLRRTPSHRPKSTRGAGPHPPCQLPGGASPFQAFAARPRTVVSECELWLSGYDPEPRRHSWLGH